MKNIKTYLVGGAVRDQLLGLPIKDRDWVVTGATPADLLQQGFKPVGSDFPVFLHPQTGEEYALARTERKTAQGYHGFQFHTAADVTLEQDLARRDLTINAMAQDTNGILIDPYGGQAAVQQRLLRHVSTAFAEDPVRILRVARFAARFAPLGFQIASETQQLMCDMVAAGEVNALVPERVWQETVRALAEPAPERFFEVLRGCGALQVLFPELDRLFGVPQPAKYHPEIDCGIHTLMVLQQAVKLSSAPEVRFAALTHDLGKGLTPQTILPSHHGHELISRQLTTQLCERLKIPNRFRELAEHVAEQHGRIHKALELQPKTVLKVLESTDAFRKPERFEQLLIACEADARGRTGFESRPYPQAGHFRQALTACQQVAVQAVIQDGFQGANIKEELHRRRIEAIKQIQRNLDIHSQESHIGNRA
ncbi:tRNA nucleotidyltransferase (CCA-adding enzyme) [Thiothrix caldifontis]|jgi:tRNA nucleotidyltransferase/poly(A) polymerase|uniref:Multifunctional CCA protein n=1 Tax=Thiothrix caldifontis TaxID=525918 RepID=A0A1H3VMH2_9GAMM|nr:multifunctional CCA addition/repair protein [Thiothrix caldifontis]SDZ75444.1 tRNA nucleotidyltransferase (CCA-adding enzyme) [Thiothrix caldifontis]